MKFINYVGTFFLLISCWQNVAQSENVHHKSAQDKSVHRITAKDIGKRGYVIKYPGQYYLTEDVVYKPDCGSSSAIRISAAAGGNVTLDLQGRTLSQKSKNVLNVDGVLIDPGLTNIIVKNGTIRDFSDAGIRAGALSAALLTNVDISDIRAFNNGSTNVIVDPEAVGDGAGGVVILNAQDINVSNSTLNENIFAGLYGFNIVKFTMNKCHCDDSIANNYRELNFSVALGAGLLGAVSDLAFHGSTFNRIQSGAIANGLSVAGEPGPVGAISVATNVLIDSCQANDNNVTLNDIAVANTTRAGSNTPFYIAHITNFTMNNCEARGASITQTVPLPAFSNGNIQIKSIIIATAKNVTLTNCSVSGQTFSNTSTVGASCNNQSISLGVQQLYIGNCHANGGFSSDVNTGAATNGAVLTTIGFDLSTVINAVVEDCTAGGHTQSGANLVVGTNQEYSIAAGFRVSQAVTSCSSTTCGPIVFRRCVSTGNMNTGTFDGLACGFSTRRNTAASVTGGGGPFIFDSCIAEGNKSAGSSTTGEPTGLGFDVFNLANSKIINCLAETNNIGIGVGTNTTALRTDASNYNIISDCTLSSNTAYGIQDLSTGNTNAYYSNRAYQNGPTPLTTNYSGAIFPTFTSSTCPGVTPCASTTPVLLWNLPGMPCSTNSNCATPTNLDNISIVNP